MKKLVVSSLVVLISVFANTVVYAGVPLNNLEGVGGIAFNPLAYTGGNPAHSDRTEFVSPCDIFGKPQFGAWYVHLGDVDIDWTTFGVAETFFKRVGGFIRSRDHRDVGSDDNIYKNNFGAKLLVLAEGDVIPAVSIGAVWKHTTFDVPEEWIIQALTIILSQQSSSRNCRSRSCYPAA